MNPNLLMEEMREVKKRMAELLPKMDASSKRHGKLYGELKQRRAELVEAITDPKMPVSMKEYHADKQLGRLISEEKTEENNIKVFLKQGTILCQWMSAIQSELGYYKREIEAIQFGEGHEE